MTDQASGTAGPFLTRCRFLAGGDACEQRRDPRRQVDANAREWLILVAVCDMEREGCEGPRLGAF
jgi:hypothetical protein